MHLSPTRKRAGQLVLFAALERGGLTATLSGPGPFTVLAPTDDAFARLPPGTAEGLDAATLEGLLAYHALPQAAGSSVLLSRPTVTSLQGEEIVIVQSGDVALINGVARVQQADLVADNGLVHAIDAVLVPPSVPFPGTLVDALAAAPTFAPLVNAVQAAGLADTLAGGMGLTVFAPTAQAFAALGDLSALPAETLEQVLLYHVVPEPVALDELRGTGALPTAGGEVLPVRVENGTVVVGNRSRVLRADYRTRNGIIHVIDVVLMPPGLVPGG